MFKTILVPLDGSTLAECVLPHVLSLSSALGAQVIFLHVLERPNDTGALLPIDPLRWAMKKQEAKTYLNGLVARFQGAMVDVTYSVQEGSAAEVILYQAEQTGADLIALSTHGSSGLSDWNVSSVVHKIIMRAKRSLLVVRAYRSPKPDEEAVHYRRIFVGLDVSPRAELVLPIAISLAQHFQADLTLGTVVERPDLVSRLPISDEDWSLFERLVERNQEAAERYLEQVRAQMTAAGLYVKTRLEVSTNTLSTLHTIVEEEQADLVMLAAHGRSADGRWPFGSVTASFIAHGNTSLFILQDLGTQDIQPSAAEQALQQSQGHS